MCRPADSAHSGGELHAATAAPSTAWGTGSVRRDDHAHRGFPGSVRGHYQHPPTAPTDARGIDGAHPVFERAVEAGVALDVDRGGVRGLGVRPPDRDEEALSVRPEPGARPRVRRLAERGAVAFAGQLSGALWWRRTTWRSTR